MDQSELTKLQTTLDDALSKLNQVLKARAFRSRIVKPLEPAAAPSPQRDTPTSVTVAAPGSSSTAPKTTSVDSNVFNRDRLPFAGAGGLKGGYSDTNQGPKDRLLDRIGGWRAAIFRSLSKVLWWRR